MKVNLTALVILGVVLVLAFICYDGQHGYNGTKNSTYARRAHSPGVLGPPRSDYTGFRIIRPRGNYLDNPSCRVRIKKLNADGIYRRVVCRK